jgi:hypothetical protein
LDKNNDEHMRNGTMKKKDEHHINEEKKEHGSIPCKKNIPARDPKQSGGVGG